MSQSGVPGGDPGDKRHKRGSARQEELAQTQQANHSTGGKKTSTAKGNIIFPLARISGDSVTYRKLKEGDSTPESRRKASDASASRSASAGSHKEKRTHAEDSTDSISAAGLEKDPYERVPWRVPKSALRSAEDKEPLGEAQPETAKSKSGAKRRGWMSRIFRRGA